ncbi:MAG: hypothetical protein AMJ68_02025 [Acidithiobacillales bacterium SG8_45]|jgi:invasion protein IalB|nr:MAG: hypothetical protein AMJ68_02025 [Acidithiobacillales bacterium SG8_45]
MYKKSKTGTIVVGVLLAGLCSVAASGANAAWQVAKDGGDTPRCYLKSSAQKMQDGYRTISVHAEIDGDNLTLVTPSNIDTTFSDLRIQVDRKEPISSTVLVGKQSVRFAITPQTVNDMRKGKALNAYIRFWPTWPVTRAHPVSFSLRGFSAASKAIKNCS